jgi:predicted O-linked N-acetylglucosamine transferase (SPINDLY family)
MKKNKLPAIPRGDSGPVNDAHAAIDAMLARREYAAARDACRKLLKRHPGNAKTLHKLGVALVSLKEFDEGKTTLAHAVALMPQVAALQNDYGIALEKLGDYGGAEAAYRRALALSPNLPEARSNLADLLFKQERPGEAMLHAQEATRLAPNNPLAWLALADTQAMHGRTDEAIQALRQAIALPPPQIKVYMALARLYMARARKEEAVAVLEKAQRLFADDPKLLNDLGMAHGTLKNYEKAQELFEAAYRSLPDVTILFNILTNLNYLHRSEQILALEQEVLKYPQPNVALAPLFGHASAHCNWQLQEKLLPMFVEWCRMDDRKLVTAAQNLLTLMPIPDVTPTMIRSVAEKVADTHRYAIRHHQLDLDYRWRSDDNPKLRIGYISGDFKLHVVNYFVSGQLSHYDKQHFEVYCYSSLDVAEEDEITAQYRQAVDKFINVSHLGDDDLARRIAADGIHLLVDLSGYTAGTRLSVMYYRPAPVQMAYIGYPFTSGLKEIDFALSDPWLNGPENAACFIEQILEIPHAYVSAGDLPVIPEVLDPPMLRNGYVTFGSLNNCYKLNRLTVATWSRILAQVPDARLVLNNPRYDSPLTQANVLAEFEANGIDRSRITIITAKHPKGIHLYWYEDLDIALDAFPQTGGTTTYESLWMGVPLITLVGRTHYERLSYSYLNNCGTEVDDLIAFDVDQYVERAVTLAGKPERIAALHRTLPANIRQALLCDPARQVRYYEEALIEGWNLKYPEHPKFTPEAFRYMRFATPAAPLVATVADPGNLYSYVIEEQGRWFAPEYGMLSALAIHLDGLTVEIGSEPGFFSLELAQAGMRTLALATSTVAARLIRAAATQGGLAERVEVRLESARTNLLDRAALRNVALLRIGVEANDGQAGPILKNPRFWRDNSPLVMLSVHSGDQPDPSVAKKLVAMGYRLYRPLPALGIFAPHDPHEPLDPYSLYLLACPPTREEALIRAGLFAQQQPVPAEAATALSEAAQASNPWQRMDEWVTNYIDQVHQTQRGANARLALLQFAIKAQMTLVESAPSTTRRLTLARLLADAGYRSHALSVLNQCIGEIEQGSASVTAPFLAPSATWDAIAPGEHLAEWLYAAIVETRCRLAAHSTYFLAETEFEPLRTLSTIGFETDFSKNALHARSAREYRK